MRDHLDTLCLNIGVNKNKNDNFYYLIIWVRHLGGTHFSEFSVPNDVNGFVC